MDSRKNTDETLLLDYSSKHSLYEFSSILKAMGKRLLEEKHFIFVNNDSEILIPLLDELNFEIKYIAEGDKHKLVLSAEWSPENMNQRHEPEGRVQ